MRTVLVLAFVVSLQAASQLTFDVPAGWQATAPASAMRVAEFVLPGAAGGAGDAAVVVYFFGAGSGGSVQANDVTGTYVAEVTPGSSQRFHEPGYRLIAAVVETPGGAHYVKLTGPADTVARWESSVAAFLDSLRME